MCELTEKVRAEGILFNIKNIMESLNLTAEKALDASKIFGKEREFYLAELKKSN